MEMVTLVQKIWYTNGTTRLESFVAQTANAAKIKAYLALNDEISLQSAKGKITVDRAICEEKSFIDLIP